MSLSVSAFASDLQGRLGARGYSGSKLGDFCTAVATGVVNTALGLQGLIATGANTGVSAGTGITITGSNISATIKAQALGQWPGGVALQPFCDDLGATCQAQFALATLASTTNGTATFASFSGAVSSMATAIKNAASFTGAEWQHFCTAIATGVCQEVGAHGTGTLTGAGGPGAPANVPVTIS